MSKDTIYRENAIDTLNDNAELLRRVLDDTDIVGAERAKYEWELELIESYISYMKELPSAEPKRKKGKWAGKGDSEGFGIFICSNCAKFAIMKSNFCPYCGADMRGEQDG